MDYKVIKTRGKKLKMYVDRDGTVVVKAPKWTRKSHMESFVKNNRRWIEEKRREHREKAKNGTAPDENQLRQLKMQAKVIMGRKTAYYASVMGVKPDEIKITSAKKRWGSCIRKSKDSYTICYSYRNMFLSDRCRDYIVVHELSHIKHMDHSGAFYACIAAVLPDYKDIIRELNRYQDYDLYPAGLK